MNFSSFAFVGDIIDLKDRKSIEVQNKFRISYANDYLTKHLKSLIAPLCATPLYDINRYETHRVVVPNSDGKEHRYLDLPKNKWRYTIIEHNFAYIGNPISLIFGLSNLDLTILMNGQNINQDSKNIGMGYSPLPAANFFTDNHVMNIPIKVVNNDDLEQIKYLTDLVEDFSHRRKEYFEIDKAIDDFESLGKISILTPFKIIGYFSILELLLTTYKANDARESSLKSQLQNKIELINNQIRNKITVTDFFKGPDTLTVGIVIGKLYQYRNNIAHGNKIDFEKDLNLLKDQTNSIIPFLRKILKEILIFSMKEPDLIKDLKKC